MFIIFSGSQSKESTCNVGDPGSIPGLERSPRGGNDNLLQHPCLGNPMDRGARRATVHGVTKVGYDQATNTYFIFLMDKTVIDFFKGGE